MLKNKKMMILFGIILATMLILINPTKSNAAEYTPLTIQSDDNHSKLTYVTTFNNWTHPKAGADWYYYVSGVAVGNLQILKSSDVIFSDDDRSFCNSNYSATISGTLNGQPKNVSLDAMPQDDEDFNFDPGSTVTITRVLDFSGITFSEPGEYDFSFKYYDGPLERIYRDDYYLISYEDICKKNNYKEYVSEDYYPNKNYTTVTGKIIVKNELLNEVPTGNLVVDGLYTYDKFNGNSKTDTISNLFTFPTMYIKVTYNLEGNMITGEEILKLAEGGEDHYSRTWKSCYNSFSKTAETGSLTYDNPSIVTDLNPVKFGYKNGNSYIPALKYGSEFDESEGEYGGLYIRLDGNYDISSYDVACEVGNQSLSGITVTKGIGSDDGCGNYDEYENPYFLDLSVSSNPDSNYAIWNNAIQVDEDGNYYIDLKINLTKNESTSYTGILYNIIPFIVVIAIASIGIIIMKKTSNKSRRCA